MTPEFAITEHPIDAERHVIAVRGEIDVISAPELKQLLTASIEAGRCRMIVDLTQTTYVDSAALGAVKRLRACRGTLAIVNVEEGSARPLVTALDQIFTILPARDAALEALASADVG